MKIPPFKEINRPNKNGYWIHPKTKVKINQIINQFNAIDFSGIRIVKN